MPELIHSSNIIDYYGLSLDVDELQSFLSSFQQDPENVSIPDYIIIAHSTQNDGTTPVIFKWEPGNVGSYGILHLLWLEFTSQEAQSIEEFDPVWQLVTANQNIDLQQNSVDNIVLFDPELLNWNLEFQIPATAQEIQGTLELSAIFPGSNERAVLIQFDEHTFTFNAPRQYTHKISIQDTDYYYRDIEAHQRLDNLSSTVTTLSTQLAGGVVDNVARLQALLGTDTEDAQYILEDAVSQETLLEEFAEEPDINRYFLMSGSLYYNIISTDANTSVPEAYKYPHGYLIYSEVLQGNTLNVQFLTFVKDCAFYIGTIDTDVSKTDGEGNYWVTLVAADGYVFEYNGCKVRIEDGTPIIVKGNPDSWTFYSRQGDNHVVEIPVTLGSSGGSLPRPPLSGGSTPSINIQPADSESSDSSSGVTGWQSLQYPITMSLTDSQDYMPLPIVERSENDSANWSEITPEFENQYFDIQTDSNVTFSSELFSGTYNSLILV